MRVWSLGIALIAACSFDVTGVAVDGVIDGGVNPGQDGGVVRAPVCGLGENCRSIGINAGVLYSDGTASIGAGDTIVTFGGGASLPLPDAVGAVGPGDGLVIGGETFFILSRDSATQVTVQSAAVSAHSQASYTITRAYTALQDWEDDRQGDLVLENRSEVGIAYNDGPFLTGGNTLRFADSTTDATHSLRLTVAEGQRHNGTAGTGVVLDGQDMGGSGIEVQDDFVVVQWFEITRVRGDGSSTAAVARFASGVVFEWLLIHDYLDSSETSYGIRLSTNDPAELTVRNSILYNGDLGIHLNLTESELLVENCTVVGMDDRGVRVVDGTLTVTNTISMNNAGGDFEGTMTQSHNLSSDATAAGTGSIASKLATDQFVSLALGSEDFHLKPGADAIDTGIDLSSSFTRDIDGDVRPAATWDIGADELR